MWRYTHHHFTGSLDQRAEGRHDEHSSRPLELTVGETGQLQTVTTSRWGNPDGGEFRSVDFGGVVEEEATFHGHTIPTRLRVRWYFANGQFASDGKFFRVSVDDAVFR